jgi:hypothetical protein
MSSDGRDTTTVTPVNSYTTYSPKQPNNKEEQKKAEISAATSTSSDKKYDQLLSSQKEADLKEDGRRVASKEQWQAAWIQKEQEQFKNNVRKEDHSDPTPLLMDKISSLPPDSTRRRNAEVLKHTLDNTTSNVGYGLDAITRELYKETQRLVNQSYMLQQGVYSKSPLPASDQLLGEEEGKKVSNLQGWRAPFTNAVRPVSDAIGSHSDTNSSVAKIPTGPTQLLSNANAHAIDNITPNFTNELNAAYNAINVNAMQNFPSKMMGSIRQLTTAADTALSIPFEIACDCYNGLLGVMDSIASLIDGVMAAITKFAISSVGGLIDGLFPSGLLNSIIGPIKKIASQVSGLSQLLGGFNAITSIANAIGGIASSLASLLSDPLKLAEMLGIGADVASIVGGLAGKSVGCAGDQLGMGGPLANVSSILDKAASAVFSVGNKIATAVAIGGVIGTGANNILHGGLGNLGLILGGGIGGNLGLTTPNLRTPTQIIPGVLPPELTNVMQKIHLLPSLGLVGNLGFSVGSIMDSICNNSFSKCMNKYATHATIISPLFNKEVKPVGSYARESNLGFFTDSPFVVGAQGNKGITAIGPGGTMGQKQFGMDAGGTINSSGGMSDAEIDKQIQQKLGPEAYKSYKEQVNQLSTEAAMHRQMAAEARRQAAMPIN